MVWSWTSSSNKFRQQQAVRSGEHKLLPRFFFLSRWKSLDVRDRFNQYLRSSGFPPATCHEIHGLTHFPIDGKLVEAGCYRRVAGGEFLRSLGPSTLIPSTSTKPHKVSGHDGSSGYAGRSRLCAGSSTGKPCGRPSITGSDPDPRKFQR